MSEESTTWSEEDKKAVVAEYLDAEPTTENTMDIVKMIAEDWDKSPNSIRMILSRAGVYVKKTAPTKTESGKSKRVVKADALKDLTKTIEDAGQDVDEDIIARLTGKAAVYFAEVINAVGEKNQETGT